MLLSIEEIETTLRETLADLSEADVRRAARAIVERSGTWREVDLEVDALGAEYSVQCRDICAIGASVEQGMRVRAFIAEPPA